MRSSICLATLLSVCGTTGAAQYTVAFKSFAPNNTDVFIADRDGTAPPRPLAPDSALDYNASFSADGQWIVWTSHRSGTADIYGVMVTLEDGTRFKTAGESVDFNVAAVPADTDNTYRWLSGESDPAFGGAIRDMWNPNCYGHPGAVSDAEYHCDDSDSGGVHENSGVVNRTFAILVDGLPGKVDDILLVPPTEDELNPILMTFPLQLLAYYAALELGRDIDQPRNLAKSVTVE